MSREETASLTDNIKVLKKHYKNVVNSKTLGL